MKSRAFSFHAAALVLLSCLVVGLTITCLVLAHQSFPTPSPPRGMPSILFLGDSNTEYASQPGNMGFQVLFAQDYVRRADTINRGCAGWTTTTWNHHRQALVDEWRIKPPRLVVIFLGTNDAITLGSLRVSLHKYKFNVAKLVQTFQTEWGSRILLATALPVDDNVTKLERGTHTNAQAGEYAGVMREMGHDLHVPVVDLWTPLQPNVSTIFRDGLHLNVAGNIAVYTLLKQGIATAYPDLIPKNMQETYK
ncbi:Aste57867_8241 [Aphanomyces stellatus]|uniref:Aste57867_8241 protein n=1 Tax=Aphanomyces stellatus TaxID=120398 RepID=A0A485KJR7_9STRA|nr:hypothetical protein As57867_008210 [Aphanomyces stellatus]VFT85128.1 Aste57867_8241 [Aphanomyces stellatus]